MPGRGRPSPGTGGPGKLRFPEPCWAAGRGRGGGVVWGQIASWQVPHLLQPPPAGNAHVVPWVAVDPEQGGGIC